MKRWTTIARPVGVRAGLLLASLLLACGGTEAAPEGASESGHGDHGESELRGPHKGRLLRSGAFELELGIFDRGPQPEYRAWVVDGGRVLDPDDVTLTIELTRLGGEMDLVSFESRAGHLVSTTSIAEPHSFQVSVEAVHEGTRHGWKYESYEGRTQIDPKMADSLGVRTETAGSATLVESVTVYGRVRTNPERVREIRARFEGVVREVDARLGSAVRRGESLLTIESNESLNPYALVAPISGTVTQRDANPGEQTGGRLLMTVTDTSSVWVDLSVFPVDRGGLVVGSAATIEPALGGARVVGTVSLLETVADPHDQTVIARVVLDDADAQLLPGTFVIAEVKVAEYEVPLAVKQTGVQTFQNGPAVYARVGDIYEARIVELGREAGEWVEVLGGLEAETQYVTANSHLIKADIEKSGAAHTH